ncbi:MAG: sporulation protein YunB [Oscillospiraceae bacterium]
MLKRKSRGRSRGGIFYGVFAVAWLAVLAAFFVFADARLRPEIATMARYRVQGLITKAVNDAVMKQADKTEVSYDDLVNIEKNNAGEILSISYNSLHMNRLKSEITYAVIEETQKIPDTDIYIPIGNILDIDFLQNKGPKLKFTFTPSSYVESDIESVFQNTGINQINHQIFIIVRVVGSALIPNFSTSITVENKVCVAETIIIGKVPNNIGNGVVYPQ